MSAPAITLWLIPNASSLFPHILLRYCDLAHTIKSISPTDPELHKINRKGQVPVLVVDSQITTENPATALAISLLAPEKQLFGKTPQESVKILEWLSWISASLHAQAWGPWLRPHRFTDDATAEAGIKAVCRQKVLDRFAHLNDSLSASKTWAVGEDFTAVDAFLTVWWRLAKVNGGFDMQPYPRWTQLAEAAFKLPAVEKTLEIEAGLLEDLKRKMAAERSKA